MADRVLELLPTAPRAAAMGRAGREHVIAHWSVDRMVQGYQDLIAGIYRGKCTGARGQGRRSESVQDEGKRKTKTEAGILDRPVAYH